MAYSPYVHPTTVNGVKSVMVDKKLRGVDARAYEFLLGFARDNELQVLDNTAPGTSPE